MRDADLFGGDDDLGVAVVPLAAAAASPGAAISLTLPVEDAGCGRGGGTLSLSLKYQPFRLSGLTAAPLPAASASAGGLGGLMAAGAGVLSAVGGLLADAGDAIAAELLRGQWERELWAMPPSGDWALLSADSRPSAMPREFEKVAFVSHSVTDTQVAVWRNQARRQAVVAFRGTETKKLRDIITDARLAPRAFNTERAPAAGLLGFDPTAPAVHDGFLEAFDSVRPRVLTALDDAVGGIASGGAGWRVFVTGHSLGGALATLFAAELASSVASGRRRFEEVAMYNYGSPRVGNRAFVEQYNALVPHSVRVVNGSDAVPTVPALLGYRHVAHGVRVAAGGAVAGEPPVPRAEGGLAAMAAAAAGFGVGSIMDDQQAAEAAAAMASLVDSSALEAHMETNYLTTLRAAVVLSSTQRGEA